MYFLKILTILLLFTILTIVTQIGGLVLLTALLFTKVIIRKLKLNRRFVIVVTFVTLYLISVFLLIPILAKPFSRVPIKNTQNLKPLNYLTVLLNRNYVTPKLNQTISNISIEFTKKHPGSILAYLDASFPFDITPLLPHLSHTDGKKLDLAFFYTDSNLNPLNKKSPSWLGYGVSEDPLENEVNTTKTCRNEGYWQYDLINRITPQYKKSKYLFDLERSKSILTVIIANKNVSKVFIEPHLKDRMGINSSKARFQGCHSVRHDDHIHLQIF